MSNGDVVDEARRGDGNIQMAVIRADWVSLHNTLPVVASNPTRGRFLCEVKRNTVQGHKQGKYSNRHLQSLRQVESLRNGRVGEESSLFETTLTIGRG